MLGDPVAAGELEEQRPVEAAHGTVIDVLDAGAMAQLGGAGARLEAILSAPGRLMLEQQAEPFGMAVLDEHFEARRKLGSNEDTGYDVAHAVGCDDPPTGEVLALPDLPSFFIWTLRAALQAR